MLQLILQEVSVVERIRIMENNAMDVLPRYEYDRLLEESELEQLRVEFTEDEIELQKLLEEKQAILEELNEKIKGKKKASAIKLFKLRTGRETVVERCFVMEDVETNELGTYNSEGRLLHSRPGKNGDKKALPFGVYRDLSNEEAVYTKAG